MEAWCMHAAIQFLILINSLKLNVHQPCGVSLLHLFAVFALAKEPYLNMEKVEDKVINYQGTYNINNGLK